MKLLMTLILALVVLGTLPNSGATQEERRIPSDAIPPAEWCPKPSKPQVVNLTVSAPAAATPNLLDFPATSCSAGWAPNFGGNTADRCLRHTFTWKAPRPECRCLSGELTLEYKALVGGGVGSSTSVNDTVELYSGGTTIPGTLHSLYTGAVTTGQKGTKTIRLNCDWLKNNRLSFLVQDDTSVTSATLRVVYCCSSCPSGQTEMEFPGTKLKYCCEGKPGMPRFCCFAQEKPAAGDMPQ